MDLLRRRQLSQKEERKNRIVKKPCFRLFAVGIAAAALLAGCGTGKNPNGGDGTEENLPLGQTEEDDEERVMDWTEEMMELEDGLSSVRYDGDYGFDQFLAQGGASSDREVVEFLTRNVILGANDLNMKAEAFGCSTISAPSGDGSYRFGRNFDWNTCSALIVGSRPDRGYASISTVNTDFIRQGAGGIKGLALRDHGILTLAALYAPLDGMNEMGLGVSVNMIQDSSRIEQETDRPDLTTTTAVRLLLNQAGNVEEAVELLGKYDLHGSMGMMIHFALADASGRSVAVEYINNEMVVTETPVVTNFYLAEGEKYGIGTAQSHERYEILMNLRNDLEAFTAEDVRDALDSVSKKNFGEFESTEWSIVFDQKTMEARYYHRENYTKHYIFPMPRKD